MQIAFKNVLLAVYFLVGVCLIVAVTSQTTKSEGLTGIGMIGGKASADPFPFARKKTFDEQLSRLTTYLAWFFLILSTAIVLLGV